MKIRYLIANAYPVGGTIRTTLTMASALAERGHDVEVVSVLKRRDRPQFEYSPKVKLWPLVDTSPKMLARQERESGPGSWARQAYRNTTEHMRTRVIHRGEFRIDSFNIRTDVALLRFLRSTHDGILVSTRVGLNLASARFAHPEVIRVGQEHLHHGLYKGDIARAIDKYYPRFDCYVTLTTGDAMAFRETLGPEVRLDTIPNAVPSIERVTADLDDKVVIVAGRLTRQKGLDMLIDAWVPVAAQRPDWELRIFGEGDMRPELEQQIEKLGLHNHVRLMGYTKKLAREMAASSIYVMTSRFEGFPMVLLEAMQCGLPIVSFDLTNGPRDLITQGVDGYVVDNRNKKQLAERVIQLMDDADLRKRMGKEAVQKAAEYDVDHIAGRWETLFAELVEEKQRTRR